MSTLVLNATCDQWSVPLDEKMRINWPTSGRKSGTKFLENATVIAEGITHGPPITSPACAMQKASLSDSAPKSVAQPFENPGFKNGDCVRGRGTVWISFMSDCTSKVPRKRERRWSGRPRRCMWYVTPFTLLRGRKRLFSRSRSFYSTHAFNDAK